MSSRRRAFENPCIRRDLDEERYSPGEVEEMDEKDSNTVGRLVDTISKLSLRNKKSTVMQLRGLVKKQHFLFWREEALVGLTTGHLEILLELIRQQISDMSHTESLLFSGSENSFILSASLEILVQIAALSRNETESSDHSRIHNRDDRKLLLLTFFWEDVERIDLLFCGLFRYHGFHSSSPQLFISYFIDFLIDHRRLNLEKICALGASVVQRWESDFERMFEFQIPQRGRWLGFSSEGFTILLHRLFHSLSSQLSQPFTSNVLVKGEELVVRWSSRSALSVLTLLSRAISLVPPSCSFDAFASPTISILLQCAQDPVCIERISVLLLGILQTQRVHKRNYSELRKLLAVIHRVRADDAVFRLPLPRDLLDLPSLEKTECDDFLPFMGKSTIWKAYHLLRRICASKGVDKSIEGHEDTSTLFLQGLRAVKHIFDSSVPVVVDRMFSVSEHIQDPPCKYEESYKFCSKYVINSNAMTHNEGVLELVKAEGDRNVSSDIHENHDEQQKSVSSEQGLMKQDVTEKEKGVEKDELGEGKASTEKKTNDTKGKKARLDGKKEEELNEHNDDDDNDDNDVNDGDDEEEEEGCPSDIFEGLKAASDFGNNTKLLLTYIQRDRMLEDLEESLQEWTEKKLQAIAQKGNRNYFQPMEHSSAKWVLLSRVLVVSLVSRVDGHNVLATCMENVPMFMTGLRSLILNLKSICRHLYTTIELNIQDGDIILYENYQEIEALLLATYAEIETFNILSSTSPATGRVYDVAHFTCLQLETRLFQSTAFHATAKERYQDNICTFVMSLAILARRAEVHSLLLERLDLLDSALIFMTAGTTSKAYTNRLLHGLLTLIVHIITYTADIRGEHYRFFRYWLLLALRSTSSNLRLAASHVLTTAITSQWGEEGMKIPHRSFPVSLLSQEIEVIIFKNCSGRNHIELAAMYQAAAAFVSAKHLTRFPPYTQKCNSREGIFDEADWSYVIHPMVLLDHLADHLVLMEEHICTQNSSVFPRLVALVEFLASCSRRYHSEMSKRLEDENNCLTIGLLTLAARFLEFFDRIASNMRITSESSKNRNNETPHDFIYRKICKAVISGLLLMNDLGIFQHYPTLLESYGTLEDHLDVYYAVCEYLICLHDTSQGLEMGEFMLTVVSQVLLHAKSPPCVMPYTCINISAADASDVLNRSFRKFGKLNSSADSSVDFFSDLFVRAVMNAFSSGIHKPRSVSYFCHIILRLANSAEPVKQLMLDLRIYEHMHSSFETAVGEFVSHEIAYSIVSSCCYAMCFLTTSWSHAELFLSHGLLRCIVRCLSAWGGFIDCNDSLLNSQSVCISCLKAIRGSICTHNQ